MNRHIVLIIISFGIIAILIGSNVYSYGMGKNNSVNSPNNVSLKNFTSNLTSIFTGPKDKPSPYDWVKEEQIKVYKNRVIIEIQDADWATFVDTNSMDPLLDTGTNAIEIVPKTEEDIHVGDIVSYEPEYEEGVIIHRVIEIGKDEQGTYYILKGDNNNIPDPSRVRFSQIKRVLVAIIY